MAEKGKGGFPMDKVIRLYVKVRENKRGQTMAEYALLLASVALIVFGALQKVGTTITAVLTNVDGKL
jgi:Flp pilus assembly pilin Flp